MIHIYLNKTYFLGITEKVTGADTELTARGANFIKNMPLKGLGGGGQKLVIMERRFFYCPTLGKTHIKRVIFLVVRPLRFYRLSGSCHFFLSFLVL